MAISMKDRFVVRAPIERVWEFLMDPHRVAVCVPGGHLQRVEPDGSFLGSIKVAVGPFSSRYKGRIQFTEIDEEQHRVHMSAEGHERGGGDAHGLMVSSLVSVDEGTEVFVDVTVDGTSKLVKVGLGFSENLAHELFEQFVSRVKDRLERGPHSAPSDPPHVAEPVQVFPLMARAFMRRFKQEKRPS